jgi:hypothetical protein
VGFTVSESASAPVPLCMLGNQPAGDASALETPGNAPLRSANPVEPARSVGLPVE